jgi:hypothetical protein
MEGHIKFYPISKSNSSDKEKQGRKAVKTAVPAAQLNQSAAVGVALMTAVAAVADFRDAVVAVDLLLLIPDSAGAACCRGRRGSVENRRCCREIELGRMFGKYAE